MNDFLMLLVIRLGLSEEQLAEIKKIMGHGDWSLRLALLDLAVQVSEGVETEDGEDTTQPGLTAADLGYEED